MKNETIKLISEAFSMQPSSMRITPEVNYQSVLKYNPDYAKECIKSITLEVFQIGKDSICDFENVYVGRNFKDEILFRWIAKACNVQYETKQS
jgi:hypothetical protein